MEQAAFDLAVRGVAIETGGTIRLSHDLVRAAALDEIPPERRVDVHRRLGEWLELTAGSDLRRLREALGHKHAAGLPCLDLAVRLVRSPHRTLLGREGLDGVRKQCGAGSDDLVHGALPFSNSMCVICLLVRVA